MIKEVTNIYGKKVKIETDGQKVYSYDNKKRRVQYNAKWVDSASGYSWTDYVEEGTVEDLETRISVFGSRLEEIYARTVGYNATDNDPDQKIWNKFVDYVKRNEEKFFDEYGDYKKDFIISEDEIREMVRVKNEKNRKNVLGCSER